MPTERTYFRIVKTDPPTLSDFIPAAAPAYVLRNASAETRRLLTGLSFYRTLAQARRKARQFPRLGAYLAELHVPAYASANVERTTSSAGHYTIWASATDLLACVVRVVPIAPKP
jgi:hypothetical protein